MSRVQTALIFLLTVVVLYMGREVFVPLTLSFLLAMLLASPVRRLERWRFPRVLAVTTVVLLASAVLTVIGWLVGHQIYSLANNLEKYRDELVQKLTLFRGDGTGVVQKVQETKKILEEELERQDADPATQAATQPATTQSVESGGLIGHVSQEAMEAAGVPPQQLAAEPEAKLAGTRDNPLYTFIMPSPPSPLRTLSTYVGFALTPIATAGLVLVFVFFILLEREDLRDRMIRLVSHGQYTLTTTAVDDGVDRIVRYIRAQAIVNGTYGIAIALGLWLIGLTLGGDQGFPSYLLWGLLAAVLRFVPYIGPWIAAAFPIAISIAAFDGFAVFAAVITMVVLIELASNNIMEPILYGATTGLSIMAILVGAVFWTWLWGPIGLLLATPLTVVLMVMGKHVPGLQFLEVLLGDRPAMTPCERVYQRLLAGDDEEALEVAEEYAEEHDLLATFDDVLLPALARSERDAGNGLLQEDRQDAVRVGMRMIIDKLGKTAATDAAAEAAADAAVEAAVDANPSTSRTSDEKRVRVAVLPAHDEADELAGLMLCRLLDDADMNTMHFSHHVLAGEMVEQVAKFSPQVVYVSSTPPSGISHVRYLLRRVRGGLEGKKLAIGVWTARSDVESLKQRLQLDSAPLATSLAQAIEQVKQITETDRFASQQKTAPDTGSPHEADPIAMPALDPAPGS